MSQSLISNQIQLDNKGKAQFLFLIQRNWAFYNIGNINIRPLLLSFCVTHIPTANSKCIVQNKHPISEAYLNNNHLSQHTLSYVKLLSFFG